MTKRELTDSELFLVAICAGVARWEPFEHDSRGEVCVNGLRWATHVDDRGVPDLSPNVVAELRNALERRHAKRPNGRKS